VSCITPSYTPLHRVPRHDMSGYNYNKTTVHEDKLNEWLGAPISGDLQDVAGIGPKNEQLLASGEGDNQIETSHQLIGKYLSLKAKNVDSKTHCDAFYFWLKAKGVNAGRNNIVLAIAERCECFFPGIYEGDIYQT